MLTAKRLEDTHAHDHAYRGKAESIYVTLHFKPPSTKLRQAGVPINARVPCTTGTPRAGSLELRPLQGRVWFGWFGLTRLI